MNRDSYAVDAKNTWPSRHSLNGAPQTPSNQLDPAKQVKPGWGDGLLETKCSIDFQPPSTNAKMPTRRQADSFNSYWRPHNSGPLPQDFS